LCGRTWGTLAKIAPKKTSLDSLLTARNEREQDSATLPWSLAPKTQQGFRRLVKHAKANFVPTRSRNAEVICFRELRSAVTSGAALQGRVMPRNSASEIRTARF